MGWLEGKMIKYFNSEQRVIGWVYCIVQNEVVGSKEGKILEFRAMSDWVGVLHRAEWEG